MPSSLRCNGIDSLWLLAVGLISSMAIVASSSRLSGTFDERFYLEAGLTRWRTGSTFALMKAGTMPLPVDVETLPLRIAEYCRGQHWDLANEYDEALQVARTGTLAFWWVLLIYSMRIARSLGGHWAGRLAVVGIAVEPNLMAHAGLATTDLAITTTLLVFGFHYAAGREGTWRFRVGLPAICLALAILAKASGLVFGPLFMLAVESHRLWRISEQLQTRHRLKSVLGGLLSWRFRKESTVIGLLALTLVYLYCGSDWQPHPKLVAQARQLPDNEFKPTAVWISEHLRIFNNAGVGLMNQVRHNLQGHGAYLLGETSPRAFWYYFPVALSIKLPLALLAAPLLAVLFCRRSLFNWATLAALALLLFSFNCRVQIGVRMQLPLIAIAIVGLSAAAVNVLTQAHGVAKATGVVGILTLICSSACSMIDCWPHQLSYVNEAWGGPANGYQLLSDSNVDWGQGLKELDDWRRRHGLEQLDVWYFGTDPAADRLPFRSQPLHGIDLPDAQTLANRIEGRYLAVGMTILYGSYVREPSWLLERLRQTRPAGQTHTFLIFDLSDVTSSPQQVTEHRHRDPDSIRE